MLIMYAEETKSAYHALLPVMKRFGATCSPREFYWAVNTAFHTAEAAQYDTLHADMFQSLGTVWSSLLRALPEAPAKQRFLDVGAGTGLVGELLQTLVPERVSEIVLLDPCEAMLQRAKTRSASWQFPSRFVKGELGAVAGEQFDVVTADSVLHHVVELEGFCGQLKALLRPGGLLITAQDPRAEATADEVFRERRQRAGARRRGPLHSRIKHAIGRKLRQFLNRPHLSPLARATSTQLLERGIIQRPMDMPAIWSVTDFHVPEQPFGIGKGIALPDLRRWLAGLELLNHLTYQYHGLPLTHLTGAEKQLETEWFDSHDPHGQLFATVWRSGK
jgi:ubiquinone/menaquinone biosynthesis C-methylase UbiE